MVMVTLTQDAQGHLDRYLRQVKAALRGHASVDAGDVERDVLGHIDAELEGQPEPIGEGTLKQVLDRLGTPDTWVPAEDLPAWRRVLNRLRSGPEDWRLAYLSPTLFVAGATLFLKGPYLWPLEPFLMLASLLMARASLALLAEHDEPVGARRWLIYPPLLVWYVPLLVVLFAWPLTAVNDVMENSPAIRTRLIDFAPGVSWLVFPLAAGLTIGLWWTLIGLLLARFRSAVHVIFWPFAGWFERRHATRVVLVGLLLALASGAILVAGHIWG